MSATSASQSTSFLPTSSPATFNRAVSARASNASLATASLAAKEKYLSSRTRRIGWDCRAALWERKANLQRLRLPHPAVLGWLLLSDTVSTTTPAVACALVLPIVTFPVSADDGTCPLGATASAPSNIAGGASALFLLPSEAHFWYKAQNGFLWLEKIAKLSPITHLYAARILDDSGPIHLTLAP